MDAKGTDSWVPPCMNLTLCISSRENCRLVINIKHRYFLLFFLLSRTKVGLGCILFNEGDVDLDLCCVSSHLPQQGRLQQEPGTRKISLERSMAAMQLHTPQLAPGLPAQAGTAQWLRGGSGGIAGHWTPGAPELSTQNSKSVKLILWGPPSNSVPGLSIQNPSFSR